MQSRQSSVSALNLNLISYDNRLCHLFKYNIFGQLSPLASSVPAGTSLPLLGDFGGTPERQIDLALPVPLPAGTSGSRATGGFPQGICFGACRPK